MVIPFLSIYLTADMGFSKQQTGWVLTAFGFGSVIGAWIGGKLSDKIGYYPVLLYSLIFTGLFFIVLQYVKSFYGFIAGIFITMLVGDALRPAVYVALNTYSKPENRTRSVTLIRLAINLGFSLGPAMGGFIIATLSYGGLFWVDGLTCLTAALFFTLLLKKKESVSFKNKGINNKKASAYRDKPYFIFLIAAFLIAFSFLQLFSTIPLFYREVHHLSEPQIGMLMAMNGMIIFLFEMPLIKFLEQPRFSIYTILIISTLVIASSFLVINLSGWTGVLIIGMFFVTIGEMLNFPFMNRFALDRAERGRSGEYMALFTMTFSVAQIFCHNSGMQLIEKFGYKLTWYLMAFIIIIACGLFIWLRRSINKEYLTNT